MKCNLDCFKCPYPDCINDEISASEMKASEARDKEKVVALSDDYRIRWAQLNSERNKANKHRHYIENKERYQANAKARYEANRESELQKSREIYQRNKEYINQQSKEYKRKKYQENPEYYRQKQREYRAKKKAERLVNQAM